MSPWAWAAMKDYIKTLQSLRLYLEYLKQDPECNGRVVQYVEREIEKIQQLGFWTNMSWTRSICTDYGKLAALHMHTYRLGRRRCQSYRQKPIVITLCGWCGKILRSWVRSSGPLHNVWMRKAFCLSNGSRARIFWNDGLVKGEKNWGWKGFSNWCDFAS